MKEYKPRAAVHIMQFNFLQRIREGRDARRKEIAERGTSEISLERYEKEREKLIKAIGEEVKKIDAEFLRTILDASLLDYEIVGGEG